MGQFSGEIIKILDELGKRFGIAIDWTQKNITPYLQDLGHRIVSYELWTSVVWLGVFGIFGLLGFLLARWDWKNEGKETDGGGFFLGGFMLVAALILSLFQIFDIIRCLTLPEVIILDFVRSTGLLK